MYAHQTYGDSTYAGISFQRQLIDLISESNTVTESDGDIHVIGNTSGVSDNVTKSRANFFVSITSSAESHTVTESLSNVTALIGISGDSIIVTDADKTATNIIKQLFGDSVTVTDTSTFLDLTVNAFVGTVEILATPKYHKNVDVDFKYHIAFDINTMYNIAFENNKQYDINVNFSSEKISSCVFVSVVPRYDITLSFQKQQVSNILISYTKLKN